jgi:hypothetical protein
MPELVSPDPSASLTPFHAWAVAAASQVHDEAATMAVVLTFGLILLVFLVGVLVVTASYRP